jgi:hypothetical protein
MTFSFDLISDLHLETWDSEFDWSDQATSLYCVVAGDITRDREKLVEILTHLGKKYMGVFYIDGNDEHRYSLDQIGTSYQELELAVSDIKNVVWLHGSCVVINGVAFLGTNGWWTYDFELDMDMEQCIQWNADRYNISLGSALALREVAVTDAVYFVNSIRKLQTQPDVKSIVLITHTVPASWIIEHDVDLADSWRFNCMGNSYITRCLEEDTMNKISTWCFGHYHKPVDTMRDGVRYISNCRGRGDTEWKQPTYYPKKITIES